MRLEIWIQPLLDLVQIRIDNLVKLRRAHRVCFIQKRNDVMSRLRADDRFRLTRKKRNRKERDPNTKQHALGKTKQRAELLVERFELHLVDDARDQPEQRPNDERRAHVDREHGSELV